MVSVTTMIYMTLGIWIVWLMSHLIANNLAFVNIICMINCFLDRIQKWMDMCNGYSDIVLNVSIWDYDNWFGIVRSVKHTFIKFVNVSGLAFFAFMICII